MNSKPEKFSFMVISFFKMLIYIKNIKNEQFSLEVEPTTKIEDIKEMIQKHEGIPNRIQRLIYTGHLLFILHKKSLLFSDGDFNYRNNFLSKCY